MKEIFFNKIKYKIHYDIDNQSNYNMKCPFCKEGSSKNKKRGYIYPNDGYIYRCYNCSRSYSFKEFLYEIDPVIYKQFIEESREIWFKEKAEQKRVFVPKEELSMNLFDNVKYLKFNEYFRPAVDINYAYEYLKSRKIPEEKISELYYYHYPKSTKGYNNSLIFPFYNNIKQIYGFQSRHIDTKRFHLEVPKGNPKLNGLLNLNLEDNIYIYEGFFDSCFTKNSISLNGSSIPIETLKIINKNKNVIFCFDNDKEGLKKSELYLNTNQQVGIFLFPDKYKRYKDINELVIKENLTPLQIEYMINSNIFYEESAMLKIIEKKLERK